MRDLLAREPVRIYVYGVILAIAALLLTFGILDQEKLVAILGIAAALLAVPAAEITRSRVTPVIPGKEE